MQIHYLPPSGGNSLLRKIAIYLLTAGVVVLALTFSVVLVVVLLVVGALGWAYLWWKTRALRKQIKTHAERTDRTRAYDAKQDAGDVIEGEVTRVDVS